MPIEQPPPGFSGKKIVFFLNAMECGGAERVAITLADSMLSLKVKVWFILAKKSGKFIESIPKNANVDTLDCKKPIRGIIQLSRSINRINPDLVICFGIYTGIAATISKKIFRWPQPIIIRNESNLSIEWNIQKLHNRILGPILSRWAARQAKIITVSNALHIPTAKFLKIKEAEISTILNPVINKNLTNKDTDIKIHPWLTDKSQTTIIAVGRLEYQKGFDILLDAFKIVLNEINCRLIIFGEGPLRKSLEDKIKELKIESKIDMPGITDSPLAQMKEASLFVLSSRFEGFGLVLVEALFSGAKVVSTDCNYGPSEILENGRYGVLVPTENPIALAHAIVQSINSPSLEKPTPEWFSKFSPENAAIKHLLPPPSLKKRHTN